MPMKSGRTEITPVAFFLTELLAISLCAPVMCNLSTNFHKELVHFCKRGVNVNNYGPQYYISTLPDLRPQLLEEAMLDAKTRAVAITKAVGGSVGAVQSVKSGVFQVTTPDSTMVSDGGAYDTSTIEKTVTSTVSVTFAVSK